MNSPSFLATSLVVCGLSGAIGYQRQTASAAPQLVPLKTATAKAAAVDYLKEVHPLLQQACGSCHLNGKSKGGLRLDSRELILKGGKSGAAAIVGKSGQSLLVKLVEGHDPDRMMPMGADPLSPKQIALLRSWIDGGLNFGGETKTDALKSGASPLKPTSYHPILEPRRPALPPLRAGASSNPIDRILTSYFSKNQAAKLETTPQKLVDDRVFARRASLDIIGLLPSPAALSALQNDKQVDKRARFVDGLLADRSNYATHWLSFWNDALRNDYAGTGYIDGGRSQITNWLYQALFSNEPYDRFVRELIDPTPQSEGFVKGIVWRGTVNASQTPPMQASQNIAQVFLGINMKCASCHDSFISDWKLRDAYGLAGVYADAPLEMVRCDKPTGKIAPIQFPYPQLGSIDGAASAGERRKQLAQLMTSHKNGRLTRTFVNRVWARLMGRGLVEPVDEMDNAPWNADLLDWLSADFADGGYDVQRLIRQIVLSRAYQMTAVGAHSERDVNFRFSGPLVKRMSSEQFADALSGLTGVWPQNAMAQIQAPQSTLASLPLASKWIWNDSKAAQAIAGGRVFFRHTISLASKPDRAVGVMSCDNQSTLWVNGKLVGENLDWQKPTPLDLAPYLKQGPNVLAIEATNWPDAATGRGLSVSGLSPAGLFFSARLHFAAQAALEIGTDASWTCSDVEVKGWQEANFQAPDWKPAVELGAVNLAIWKLGDKLSSVLEQAQAGRGVRSALTTANALTTALGRPNREQVVTNRASVATTLQSLELTNGQTLSAQLKQGAARWMNEPVASNRDLIERIWARSLNRKPNATEMQSALALLATPDKAQGIEDLLWIVAMLPEFQLIS